VEEAVSQGRSCLERSPNIEVSPTELGPFFDLQVSLPKLLGQIDEALEVLAEQIESPLSLLDCQISKTERATNLRIVLELARALSAILQSAKSIAKSDLSDKLAEAPGANRFGCKKTFSLTRRQRQVLELLVQGKSNKQIAHSLKLGEGTVKVHMAALFRALGASNRAGAAVVGLGVLDQLSNTMSHSDYTPSLVASASSADSTSADLDGCHHQLAFDEWSGVVVCRNVDQLQRRPAPTARALPPRPWPKVTRSPEQVNCFKSFRN